MHSDINDIRVLIVEDEPIAAEYLKEILEEQGITVLDIVDTGREAISRTLELKPDVVFMDIMLEDNVSGAEAALSISRQSDHVKIIFLTAYTTPEMVDYAVSAKAVGYLTKPYNEAQIIATLRLVAQQEEPKESNSHQERETVELCDGYTYNFKQKRLLKDAKEVELSPKTLKLMQLLCNQPNISVSNEQISLHIWEKLVDDRTLRSLVFRVRTATTENLIKNVSGTGYMVQSSRVNK